MKKKPRTTPGSSTKARKVKRTMSKRTKTKRIKLESYYYKDLDVTKRKAADRRLRQTYGIGTEDYDRMFMDQGGRCWICQRLPTTIRFSVDHIHHKGYKDFDQHSKREGVRGILCFTCNVNLKGFEKTNSGEINRLRVERTWLYFQKHRLKGE